MMLSVVVALGVFCLSGCKNSHGIPNGKYVPADGSMKNYTLFRNGVKDNDYYYRIRGNKAFWFTSNLKTTTYEIMYEDGKIYFYDEKSKREFEYDRDKKTFSFVAVIYHNDN